MRKAGRDHTSVVSLNMEYNHLSLAASSTSSLFPDHCSGMNCPLAPCAGFRWDEGARSEKWTSQEVDECTPYHR
ncbi:hypothetical protein AGABI1DRAFT_83726 [Agaricus bisporus var. burnettii JB137-S8]|uniref:Uncharacterized protein n=1 Tax=Agaricus bisporus var. burnettii (strain JB137-S8 / ATCC MYA-4627 / FGSC 10392) TaxID=597362 RepID=K5XCD4_AGABU|nr:hypothetical protein AGABI2DRAFT_135972 [Agaricus bisporus var. bisporus H97]XP_007328371.1 uncharacterized protein AGABI1DRAFT_83726 [Agaricus bisporus var. burnettii JB137-S8]EKM80762.1 hypothetical protein AGABI1DRAFT_83726 [Agaricus bisporus var. burnettii JB137-S8]EKV47229.1 hypothetical protein AGABI2DRAFT_135972 [Agaricus bisporus var. bisporus H97]